VVASSVAESEKTDDSEIDAFEGEEVGSGAYLNRHNTEMFEAGRSFSGNERHKIWFNTQGKGHADLSDLSGADSPNDGRAAIATDFDDDGDVDIFIHNLQRERHTLYRNDLGAAAGFVKVHLQATTTQYEAIGSVVTAVVDGRRTAQILSRGAGFVSCQAPELVFGLGGASTATLEVRWPSGEVESFGEVKKDARVKLVQGTGASAPLAAHTTRLPDPLPRGFKISVGDTIPTLAVLDADGQETTLDPKALAAGGELYLNFWASYCASCVRELPDLENLDQESGVHVVALSMDAPADLHAAHELFVKRGAGFPGYYLGAAEVGESGPASVQSVIDIERLPIPSTVVLDASGKVTRIISGPLKTP